MLPKNIKLNNHTVTIDHVDGPVIDKVMINMGPPGKFAGYYDHARLKIGIAKDVHKQRTPRIFLHEVLHACLGSMDMPKDKEEEVVEHLEERLVDFIKNNPKAIKYLMENL